MVYCEAGSFTNLTYSVSSFSFSQLKKDTAIIAANNSKKDLAIHFFINNMVLVDVNLNQNSFHCCAKLTTDAELVLNGEVVLISFFGCYFTHCFITSIGTPISFAISTLLFPVSESLFAVVSSDSPTSMMFMSGS